VQIRNLKTIVAHRVRALVDFHHWAKLQVRTEDQVDTRAGSIDLVRIAVALLIDVIGGIWLPLGATNDAAV
jgi:hypothetical protein